MKRFVLHYDGLDLEVEYDGAAGFYFRPRLVVDGEIVDERHGLFYYNTTLRCARPRRLLVKVKSNFWGRPKTVTLVEGDQEIPFTTVRS